MSLKKEYMTFIARVRTDGGRLLKFTCPCCQEEIETLVPSDESVWDSLSTCPYCEGTFFKVATATQVETSIPEGEI